MYIEFLSSYLYKIFIRAMKKMHNKRAVENYLKKKKNH